MRRSVALGSGAPADHPPVVVSHEFMPEEDVSIHDLSGHLRVTTERIYQLEVPCEQTFECPRRFTLMSNPLNQCGPLLSEQVPVVTGSDYDSFMAAFNKRCNTKHQDDLDDVEFDAAYCLLDSLESSLFEEWEENDLDRQKWMRKFDPLKRGRMADAMHTVPDCSFKYVGTKDLSVKQEVLLKRNDPSWAPRVIFAGNDAFNAITGPAMMVAMERLEALLAYGPIGPVTYRTAYKKNDVNLARFITEDGTLAHTVEGDYSANDKHQRRRVHLLFDKYLQVIRMPPWIRLLLLELNKFTVQSRHFGLQAKLENQLPTGTTSTTVRNTVYNILMFSVACKQQNNHGRALVLGDDLLGRLFYSFNLQLWTECVSRFKMVLKAKAPRLNGEATFLSKRIFADTEIPCMVPLLGKALARFNARALYQENKTSSQYMAGKSLSYAYEFRHVPFMRDFFLERFVTEDQSRLSLDDLTWTAKTSGIDLANIVPAIKSESVLISDDDFRDWCMETYDLGLCDLEEICELVLLSDELTMVDHSAVSNLSIDW
jgi:hypothetical protein